MGYCVKLDTNGYRPDILKALIDARLVDYVAMDLKSPLSDYERAAAVPIDVSRIVESISLLQAARVGYEFRTTVVPGLLVERDIESVARLIRGAQAYYLQQFSPHNTLDPEMQKRKPYPAERIRAMAELARLLTPNVGIRGV
jgi:pyruvate formate lyase activating enzyme